MTLDADVRVDLRSFTLEASLTVAAGEVVALLGPNGAGKSTLLRAIAGLQPVGRGRVRLDGRVLEDAGTGVRLPPEEREMGIVFQDGMLFPHLSVLENVTFGLRARGVAGDLARERAMAWLERLDVAGVAGVRPRQLSGGQAQRVALARALVVDPRALALDEPLSALDVATRAEARRLLHRHLHSFPGPALVVTHDPMEALTLGDRLVILEEGRVTQAGTIPEVTRRPRSEWVARLVGANLYRGRASEGRLVMGDGMELVLPSPAHGELFALVRPQAVSLHLARPSGSPRNAWPGRVTAVDLVGDRVRVEVDVGVPVVAEITPASLSELGIVEGKQVWAAVKASEVEVYPFET